MLTDGSELLCPVCESAALAQVRVKVLPDAHIDTPVSSVLVEQASGSVLVLPEDDIEGDRPAGRSPAVTIVYRCLDCMTDGMMLHLLTTACQGHSMARWDNVPDDMLPDAEKDAEKDARESHQMTLREEQTLAKLRQEVDERAERYTEALKYRLHARPELEALQKARYRLERFLKGRAPRGQNVVPEDGGVS